MHIYRFDNFEFNTQTLHLDWNGIEKSIRPKAALLLQALIEHPNTLQSKEDLLNSVWQDCHVSDAVLFQTIAELRRLLGTHSRDCKYIRNVKGQGYLWIFSPLEVTPIVFVEPTPAQHSTSPIDAWTPPKRVRRRHWPWLLCFIVAILLSLSLFWRDEPDLSKARTQMNLRVLPFQDETGSAETAALGPALAELIAWQLAKHGQVLTDLCATTRLPEEHETSPENLLVQGHCQAVLSGRFHRSGQGYALSVYLDTLGFPRWERTFLGSSPWECVRGLNRALALRLGARPPTNRNPFVSESAARAYAAGLRAQQETALEPALAHFQRALLEEPDQDQFRLALALVLARLGHPRQAQNLARTALLHAEGFSSPSLVRACLDVQAQLEHERGDLAMALAFRLRARDSALRWSTPPRLRDLLALADTQAAMGAFAEARANLATATKALSGRGVTTLMHRLDLNYYHCSLELGQPVAANLVAVEEGIRFHGNADAILRSHILAARRALSRGNEVSLTEALKLLAGADVKSLSPLYLELRDLVEAMRSQSYERLSLPLLERMADSDRSRTACGRARLALARAPALAALGRHTEALTELEYCDQFLTTTSEPEAALDFSRTELQEVRAGLAAQP